MGFVKDPKGVTCYVLNKEFTEAEKKELSLIIQASKRKAERAKMKRTGKKVKVMA